MPATATGAGLDVTLIFVRHGESVANARRLYAGWSDFDLTDHGRAQAEAVARRLEHSPAGTLYSSPLLRARRTAEAIAARNGLQIEELPDLREHGFGEGEGKTREQVNALWGAASPQRRIPGEEPWPLFRQRVERAFDALLRRHASDTAICVGHGAWLLRAAAYVWGLGPADVLNATGANCAVTVFESIDGSAVVTAWNDACHLRPEPGAEVSVSLR